MDAAPAIFGQRRSAEQERRIAGDAQGSAAGKPAVDTNCDERAGRTGAHVRGASNAAQIGLRHRIHEPRNDQFGPLEFPRRQRLDTERKRDGGIGADLAFEYDDRSLRQVTPARDDGGVAFSDQRVQLQP